MLYLTIQSELCRTELAEFHVRLSALSGWCQAGLRST